MDLMHIVVGNAKPIARVRGAKASWPAGQRRRATNKAAVGAKRDNALVIVIGDVYVAKRRTNAPGIREIPTVTASVCAEREEMRQVGAVKRLHAVIVVVADEDGVSEEANAAGLVKLAIVLSLRANGANEHKIARIRDEEVQCGKCAHAKRRQSCRGRPGEVDGCRVVLRLTKQSLTALRNAESLADETFEVSN